MYSVKPYNSYPILNNISSGPLSLPIEDIYLGRFLHGTSKKNLAVTIITRSIEYKPHTNHNSSVNTISVEITDISKNIFTKKLICLAIPMMEGRSTIEIYSGTNYINIPNKNTSYFNLSKRSYSKIYDLSENLLPEKYHIVRDWLLDKHANYNWPGPTFERSR